MSLIGLPMNKRSPLLSGSIVPWFIRCGWIFAVSAAGVLLSACDPPEVRIEVTPDLADATIQVDFIRVPRERLNEWMRLDVDAYFSHGNRQREGAIERGDVYSVFVNVPDRLFRNRIPPSDTVWTRYPFERRRTDQSFDIFIVADIPGVWDSSREAEEVRIRRIPLVRSAWSLPMRGLRHITISISSKGIELSPAPREDDAFVWTSQTTRRDVSAMDREEPSRANLDVVAPSQLDGPLRPLSTPSPRYPASFVQRQLSGQVRTVILIDETGSVIVLEILGATHPEVIPFVMEALEQWRFESPSRNGEPVRVRAIQPINYDFG